MIESDAPDVDVKSTVEVDASGASHALVDRFWLVVTKGPDSGATHTSTGERTVIGTHDSADFALKDTTVSRFHCEIAPRGGKIVVRDLGSRNGTLVDGTSVIEGHARHGARLTLGHTELRLELQQDAVRVPISSADRFGAMVGTTLAMRRVFALLERAAQSEATILLTGETGTGKEMAARSIHESSPRRDGPFVVIDCGAIPHDLLESELFGHEKGAFTGATYSREGAFEAAAEGTVFLDEIGELAMDLQPKLLRAIEQREVRRIGTNTYRPIDVRVVAASNRNLRGEVNSRRFRSDLYYRIAVVDVVLPPLRERREDINVLAAHLLEGLGVVSGFLSEDLLAELTNHAWPGNVRELRNYLERCVALREPVPLAASEPVDGASPELGLPLKVARERWTRKFEREYVEGMLARHEGNVRAAAREAGVDRMHFYRMLWRYGLR